MRDALLRGADANLGASCRTGSIDRITHPATLIATGDLHDNPLHLKRLVEAARLDDPDANVHLTLHEIIHSDRLLNGMDFSYRMLTRVAALKAERPERVHTLLANHELGQMIGATIVKSGVRMVQAFNDAIEHQFESDAPDIIDAVNRFIRSMPLALRAVCPKGDILCAHSLPSTAMMGRFDTSILARDLTDDDYVPRMGSAHIMVWGRGYDGEQLEDLVERWGINLFILGHEHTDHGVTLVEPNAVVLNSDHDRGKYLEIDLAHPMSGRECVANAIALSPL